MRRGVRTLAKALIPNVAEGNPSDSCGADRGTQLLLALAWTQNPDLALGDVEFRNFSENGEDGILLYLFALAGHGSRRAVEMCAGVGFENNTANLVVHHGWDALMVDGDADLLAQGAQFFKNHKETRRVGPNLTLGWITRDNVNEILTRCGYDRDVDLLSIDMDGVDYWILEAIELTPRIVVVEYNNRIPFDLSLTVPYTENFMVADDPGRGAGFFGASLGAFNKQLTARGYRLIGANRNNTNAFFARNDVLPERGACTVESCLTSRWATHQRTAHWSGIAEMEWVAV